MKKIQKIILGGLIVGVGFLITDFYGVFGSKHGRDGASIGCDAIDKNGREGNLMHPNGADGDNISNDKCGLEGDGYSDDGNAGLNGGNGRDGQNGRSGHDNVGHGENGGWGTVKGGRGGDGGTGYEGARGGDGGHGGAGGVDGGDGGRGGDSRGG